jgi:hypothetical protein
VVFHGDGGGKAQAVGQPLIGQQRVMRLIGGLFRRAKLIGAYARLAWVNGQPGAVMYDAEGRVASVVELDVADGVVQAIHSVVNPDKLGHIGPVSDVTRRPEKRNGHSPAHGRLPLARAGPERKAPTGRER